MNKSTVINTLISSVGGALIGSGITYIVVKRVFKKRADTEIAEVKRYYALVRKEANVVGIYGDMPSEQPVEDSEPRLSAEEAGQVQKFMTDLGYSAETKKFLEDLSQDPVVVNTTIFDHAVNNPGPELDGRNGQPIETEIHEEEETPESDGGLYQRIEGQPYILTVDEYFNTEEEWEKSTLSYYEEDDTVIDEREKPLDDGDRERYIGERHLQMFGIKSGDKNVVYVRSPQISTDFEIIREKGKYHVRVLGMAEEDLEEDPKPQLRRMRLSD